MVKGKVLKVSNLLCYCRTQTLHLSLCPVLFLSNPYQTLPYPTHYITLHVTQLYTKHAVLATQRNASGQAPASSRSPCKLKIAKRNAANRKLATANLSTAKLVSANLATKNSQPQTSQTANSAKLAAASTVNRKLRKTRKLRDCKPRNHKPRNHKHRNRKLCNR